MTDDERPSTNIKKAKCIRERILYDILEKEDHDKIMQICFKAVIRHGEELRRSGETKEKPCI